MAVRVTMEVTTDQADDQSKAVTTSCHRGAIPVEPPRARVLRDGGGEAGAQGAVGRLRLDRTAR